MRLRGKVAFVTGAGRGLGREVAVLFAREGAKVIAADLDASSGEQTVELIRRRGGKALFVEGDVGVERDVKRMLDAGARKFRALHILYNSAHALWRDRDASATDLPEAAVLLGRLAHPRDIASAALFLASDDAAYLTGAEIVVDGGLSLRRLPSH